MALVMLIKINVKNVETALINKVLSQIRKIRTDFEERQKGDLPTECSASLLAEETAQTMYFWLRLDEQRRKIP